jgi:hypothetical protein
MNELTPSGIVSQLQITPALQKVSSAAKHYKDFIVKIKLTSLNQ